MTNLSRPLQHVAIIMDGNGRWANQQGHPRLYGHQKGVDALKIAIESAIKAQVPYLTVWAFSTENWGRPADEVRGLMELFKVGLQRDMPEFHRQGIRFRVLGLRAGLDPKLLELIEEAEALTANNRTLNLTVAFNYGGRADILYAVKRVAEQVAQGKVQPADITEDLISENLLGVDLPDPDLIIRTGKVSRLSNFMLWQGFYAELVFQDILWPEFSEKNFQEALEYYTSCQRNFGRVAADVTTA